MENIWATIVSRNPSVGASCNDLHFATFSSLFSLWLLLGFLLLTGAKKVSQSTAVIEWVWRVISHASESWQEYLNLLLTHIDVCVAETRDGAVNKVSLVLQLHK